MLYLKCALSLHNTMPQMLQVLRERAIDMLTAGMFTRAVTCELNIHFTNTTTDHVWTHQPRTSTSTATRTTDATVGCTTKECLYKLLETISGKFICVLVILTRVLTLLQFIVITDLTGQMLTFEGVLHFGEVFSSRMKLSFHCTGQMPMLWRECPMVVVALWYGQA